MAAEKAVLQNLRRIEGQVKGLQRMVEDGRACDEILVQIKAIKAALNRVTTDQVDGVMTACMRDLPRDEAQAKLAKIIRLLAKM